MHSRLRVLVGSLAPGILPDAGADRVPDGTILLDLGPDHPSRTGLLELRLWTDDAVISAAEVVVGAMHRGAEKLFEVRDYRQILMLADRHDWQAAFSGELGIALACERALGLEAPPRAVWLRTLLAEHTRILSHLGFLGYVQYALERPNTSFARREQLRGQLQRLTGNRIHPMINRLGGLAADADREWLDLEADIVNDCKRWATGVAAVITEPPFSRMSAGVAPLDPAVISQYGVSGPAARASGVRLDLRDTEPYLVYPQLAEGRMIEAEVTPVGDARARFAQLAAEIAVSAELIMACIDQLRALSGPIAVKLGKIVKLPEGETYLATEAPLGMAGFWIVSRGEKTPWRLKLRTASFNNIAALEAILPGCRVDQLEVALASMGYVVGDIDK